MNAALRLHALYKYTRVAFRGPGDAGETARRERARIRNSIQNGGHPALTP